MGGRRLPDGDGRVGFVSREYCFRLRGAVNNAPSNSCAVQNLFRPDIFTQDLITGTLIQGKKFILYEV